MLSLLKVKWNDNPLSQPIVNSSALIGREFIGYLFGIIFPVMGLQAHAFYGLAPIYMCFLMIYGLLRMQWETIQDLRNGLEEKVAFSL